MTRPEWETCCCGPRAGRRSVASKGYEIELRFIEVETRFSKPSSTGRATLTVRVPKIDFMRWHLYGFAFSLALTALTIGLFFTVGLNYGIDFTGGTLIEVRTTNGPADLAAMRSKLDSLNLGEASLQAFNSPGDCSSSLSASSSRSLRFSRRW